MRQIKRTLLLIPILLMCSAASCTGSREPSSEDIQNIKIHIEDGKLPSFVSKGDRHRKLWDWTKQVYTMRQFRPAWSAQGRVQSNTDDVLRTLENAPAEGLRPEDFDVAHLRGTRDSFENSKDATAQNEFDLHVTYALVRYISQLCFGRIDPREINPKWPAAGKGCDVAYLANDAIQQDNFETLADQLSPKIPEYRGLRTVLQKYREIAAQGGWQPLAVDAATKATKSKVHANPDLLAANLRRMGDLDAEEGQPVSAEALNEALSRFQQRHGLDPDKMLDEKSVRSLNVPVEQRIAQIETNMDRMRWIADRLEPRYLRVNVPGFQLSVHENDQVPLQMRVIVGSSEDRTPILDATMEYLVFSPYWNIPLSIATEELLPKIRKDPNYLRREQMEVVQVSGDKVQTVDPSRVDWDKSPEGFEYQLRQRPGAANALGLVKFIFPNPYNVYLHDTPADNLFDRLTRTLSHGCIRVERPAELAAYVLRDQPEWTPQRIQEAMHAEKEKKVPLKSKLPVHIVYWTAWVDSEGKVQFREDVYGYDETQRGLAPSS